MMFNENEGFRYRLFVQVMLTTFTAKFGLRGAKVSAGGTAEMVGGISLFQLRITQIGIALK